MRIDKFLKVSRLIKRRTVAKNACESGRVYINESQCKPGSNVCVGDIIELQFASGSLKVKVLDITDKQGKDFAETMYEVIR